MLTSESVKQLQTSLCGKLIQPGDPGYDEARKNYNAMIDKRPAYIAQCTEAADVVAAVTFGRESNLEIAVRGGGHHGAGLSTVDDGLVIDLSQMKSVQVDPQAKTARVQGGCTLGDVDKATVAFGLAVPIGINSTTGIGGLTLGGGIGNMTRSFGLTIDNLLEVEVVLADGSLVTANKNNNADLYWAVRGGGGNFGVVTSFLFRLHPVRTVYGGPIFYEMSDAAKVFRLWQEFILEAPEEVNVYYGFHTVPPVDMFPKEHQLKPMGTLVWCYTGDISKAEEVVKPFRQVATPTIDFAGPMPLTMLQSLFDPLLPPGMQWYWNADFFTRISDDALDLCIENFSKSPTWQSLMHLYPINGAAHRVGRNDTAWSYREANFATVIAGVTSDPAGTQKIITWSKSFWQALHPHSAGGGYVNMMMNEGQERVQAAYRDNYPRLKEIKKKFDPMNLFHMNQNIKP